MALQVLQWLGIVGSVGFLGTFVAGAMSLSGWQYWVVQGAFVLVGIVFGWIAHVLLGARRRAKAVEASTPATADLADRWREARGRLAAARHIDQDRVGRSPLLLVLGPADSAKTTTVLRSGLEPELLAGADAEGGTAVPTTGVNAWYGAGWTVVEAAADVLDDPERWEWLGVATRADRLGAALGGGKQAPRMVLLCYPCSRLVGAGTNLRAEAQSLRAKLGTLAQALGVDLPVYLLLTKLDQVSYFTDFTRSLTPAEAQQILGATLKRGGDPAAEAYAQAETRQVGAAFDAMIRSLALRRTDLLRREASEEVRTGAFEFPRELSKLKGPLTEFVVELGRPSQLGVGPFVRGFYFTGVRPVVVEATTGYAAPAAPTAPSGSGATMVFNPAATPAAAPTPSAGTRRVPQWAFLPSLLRSLVFADRAALAVTESGTRVSGLRRALATVVIALAAVWGIGMTVSWLNNRSLRADLIGTAAQVRSTEPLRPPTEEALSDLDSLGTLLRVLREYDTDGPPLRYRWGLYRGENLLRDARAIYFDRFAALLGEDANGATLAYLQQAAQDRNPSERQPMYDALKAHLMTHDRNDRASEAFLPDILLVRWSGGTELPVERADLVRRQFALYARELPLGNPFDVQQDDDVVAQARAFLQDASADELVYQAITGSVEAEDVSFGRASGNNQVVTNDYVVRAAYTKPGWNQVQQRLSGSLLDDEDWVLGDTPLAPENVDELRGRLAERYRRDYVTEWQTFLDRGNVSVGSVDQAPLALSVVGDANSPLVRLLGTAASHTDVDSTMLAAFQPVHLVAPPNAPGASADALPYLNALRSLADALTQLVASPDRQVASIAVNTQIATASNNLTSLENGMSPAPESQRARSSVRALLQEPIDRTRGLLNALPVAELNERGGEFCRALSPVLGRYPFGGGPPAAPADVQEALAPGASTLWNFHDEHLQNLVEQVGTRYRRAPGASPAPTTQFVGFFDAAARVSRGLFPDPGSRDIEIALSLDFDVPPGFESITAEVGGRSQTWTRTISPSMTTVWRPGGGTVERIALSTGSAERDVITGRGTWSLFELFDNASWSPDGPSSYRVVWTPSAINVPLEGRVSFSGAGVDVLNRSLLRSLSCVSRIAR